MNNSAAYLDPVAPTCSSGNTLGWFMVSGGLAIAAETNVDKDTQIYHHYPVQLKAGGQLSEDMGVRIRRPSASQGITKKETKKGIIPEGDFKTKEGTIKLNLDQTEPRSGDLPLPSRRQQRKISQRKRTEGHLCQKHDWTTARQH
eukprot:10284869-Heterocapsa_arctica.AAC.1